LTARRRKASIRHADAALFVTQNLEHVAHSKLTCIYKEQENTA
jgi:hypothetical protein